MPIYEYECDKCGHAFEREQSMSEPPVKTCPKCKGRKVTKLISRSSFVLKGGGWYADGYADAKKKKAATESTTSDTSDASSSGASEAKGASESKGATDSSSGDGGKKAATKPAKSGDKSSTKSTKASKSSGKSAA